jgi:gliding motility-associated-like protein
MKKHLFLLFCFLFVGVLCYSQVSENYYFFKGDTLDGFDVKTCLKNLLDEHLPEANQRAYIKGEERQFVEKKYHLPAFEKPVIFTGSVLTTSCNNMGFETGNYTGWTGYIGYNTGSRKPLTVGTAGISTMGLNSAETSCSMFTLVNAAAGTDPWGGFPMLDPLPTGGTISLRMGGENSNFYSGSPCNPTWSSTASPGECIQQTFPVTAANAMFVYDYAVVLEQGTNHDTTQCPYFRAEVLDDLGKLIPCLQYYVESDSTGVPTGMSVSPNSVPGIFGSTPVYYSAWKTNTMNLKNYIGRNVTVRFTTAGCKPGGHFGYAYVDASCGPVEVISSSPEVCAGNTITLTAPGAGANGTYAWTTLPSGTAGISGLTTGQTVTINAAGTYEVTVTQAPGCFYKIDTTIAFYPNPVMTVASTNASCSPGSDGTATATVTAGNAPYTYSWSPGNPTGQGTATISGLGAGTYNLTVTTKNGCTTTGSATVTQPPGAPVITITNTPASCSPGADGTATATVTGGATPYTYSWSPGNPTGQGTNAITGLNGGTYILTVTTPNASCPAVATTTVTQPNGPTATSTTTNVSCFGLSDGTATVTANGGSAPLAYAWTGSASTTNSATALGIGTYTCVISDSKGCSYKIIDTIKQPPLLTLKATKTDATCHNLCNGSLICVPTGGTATYGYAWTSGCTQASCTNVCPGRYTATVTDAHGCKATDTITVSQPPGMIITMNPKATHCGKSDGSDTVHVTGGTPGYTYNWSPQGGTGTVATGIPAGTYTVIVKDSHGCLDTANNIVPNLPGVNLVLDSTRNVKCFGGSDGMAAVTASGGFPQYTYAWTPGGQTTPKAIGLSAGTYVCTLTDSAGCKTNVTATILQPPLLTVTTKPATICLSGCTDLSAQGSGGTPAYTYTWVQGVTVSPVHVCPTVTSTYTVGVVDAHGCLATAPVIITVNPPLEVTASGGKPICPGGSAQLNADGHGGNNGPYTYTWIPPSGLSSSTIPNPVATPTVTTIYTVIIADNCGTPTDSSMTTVTVFPAPVLNLTYKDSVICGPDCFKFTATSTTGCASATWTFGDGTKTNGCNSAKHCYNKAGPYTVTYTILDGNGCPGTVSVIDTANLLPIPVAEFSYTPNPASILAPTITFTDQSSGPPVTWDWHFGNPGDSSTMIQNPVFTYTDTGCYTVTLLVSAADGCTSQVSHPVCIQPYFTFYAPNTFTPNGDGKNDIWMPYGIGIDPNNYDLIMFDRWGNLMFETHVWGEGWDGRANHGAEIAQIDTYVWKVVLKDVFHIKHQYMGHCNIIR